ncbi:caprin homolog [Phymastichus coffea]|uniref:caprin homolog n=1 Tax=Phymastichus coffea TaxID=108790 RepID=UPI00273AEB02|nr:caprin homolog [Phymastichus coffea]
MPSANPNSKLEKQASTEALDPIRQAITVIEHKIRNLEKRKGKLESYRDIVKNGGELNADQKTAVAKYDEVQQTLENMRDLYKQINSIATDAQRQQKKLARIEALERMRQDIVKVREVLLIQDTLMNMGAQGVRQDFINGVNGAVQLAEQELKFLDDLYNEVMLKHDKQDNDVTFLQQAQKVAEHYVLIVDGKQRDVVGTTYAKIKEVINSIVQCGYFDQASEVAVEEVTKAVVETHISHTPQAPEQVNEEFGERHIPPPPETILRTIQTFPVVSAITPVSSVPLVAQPIPAMQAPVDPSYYTNATTFVATQQVQPQQPPQQPQQQQQAPAQRINEVIGPAPNFYFLQDSELDQPPEGNASQAPPVVSHIPSLPVVAGAVTINAPIPTQTFTNQTFTGPPVGPPQVMYQHQPPQDISHMAPFNNTNPPPPIPMPQAHQPTMQFNQQTQSGFQQQQQQQQQPSQTFEQMSHQDSLSTQKDESHDNTENITNSNEKDTQNETNEWGQVTDGTTDWSQVEHSPPSNQEQNSQQAWGNRGGYRGRGRGRGNSNSYNNRGRGNYQQNGRGYYNRNNDGGNYQNGYQRNNWSNSGDGSYQPSNGGYKNNFNRNNAQPRGERRDGDRSGMDRGNRGSNGGGGQYRSNQRGTNRNNYVPRGNKAQTQN